MSRSTDARNALGTALINHHPAEVVAARRRELAEAKIADAIERALAEAPPLTDQQRQRLAALLTRG